jgi:hypothetical protein
MVSLENPATSVLLNVLYLVCRYMHLVGGMLLVGGILFYETVVPIAIADLRAEVQLAIFARARWVFRWVVWSGVAIMVLTGVYMTVWKLNTYIQSEFIPQVPYFRHALGDVPWPLRTGWWWAAHVVSAVLAMSVAAHMVSGDRPPRHPVSWLRLDLMVLLIVVFFATVTRQVDQIHHDRAVEWIYSPLIRLIDTSQEADSTTLPTAPATAPANQP